MYSDLLSNRDLCRFCLETSDKLAISLESPQILVSVDRKLEDFKKILQFLLINYCSANNLPNLICTDCKTIIIKFYSLKKTFLENERTLTTKAGNFMRHESLQHLMEVLDDFCGTLDEEDQLKVAKYSNKIVVEKFSYESSEAKESSEFFEKESITIQNNQEENYTQYCNEEYIEDEEMSTNFLCTSKTEDPEDEKIYFEDEDEEKEQVKSSQETEYEIPISDQDDPVQHDQEDSVQHKSPKHKSKSKRKQKTTIENLEKGLISKKYKVYLDDSNVIVHEDQASNSFMCSNCSTTFQSEKLANDHVLKYGKNKYCTQCKCDDCLVIFASPKLYQKHKSFHILSKISSIFSYFDCMICNYSFGNEKDFDRHLERHARDANYSLMFDGRMQLEGCEIVAQNPHYHENLACGHCGMRFALKNDLNFHLTLFHASLFCPFDKQPYGKSVSYLIDHLKSKHPEQFEYGDITYSCSHCFDEFPTKPEMKEHEKYCESKKYECSHCDKKFGLERQLKEHLEYISGNLKFSCIFCEKKFNNKSAMTVHMRIHSNEKPYACTHHGCDKTFRTNSHRSAHMDLHNETKNFKCSYCPVMLQTRAAKRSHEKSHSYSHVCPLCQKDFKQRSHLVRHANIVHKIKCGSADLEAEIDKFSQNVKNFC